MNKRTARREIGGGSRRVRRTRKEKRGGGTGEEYKKRRKKRTWRSGTINTNRKTSRKSLFPTSEVLLPEIMKIRTF